MNQQLTIQDLHLKGYPDNNFGRYNSRIDSDSLLATQN